MPAAMVRIGDPELFYDDDSIFHQILARRGIQKGDYEVNTEGVFPALIFDELSDDAARELEESGEVQIIREG